MPPELEPTRATDSKPAEETEITSGPPSVILPPNLRPRRQIYAFAACMALLVFGMVAERIHMYLSQGTPVYSSSSRGLSAVSPVKNELQPLATQQAASSPGNTIPPASAAPVAVGTVPPNPLSSVTAWAYLVGNVKTGQIYLSHNAGEVLPIASLSKLTTALVARQFMSQSLLVPITQQVMDVYPNAYGLELGERFSVAELYYPMLLQSNDNAAEAFAYAYADNASGTDTADQKAIQQDRAGPAPAEAIADTASSSDTAFVGLMNEYAGELGMTHSHFLDASGLSDGNVSTPSDLFLLARFLYADKFNDKLFTPNIFAITTLPDESVSTTTKHFAHDFVNINPFVGNPAFVGGKTGRTNAAGETMLSIFNYQLGGQNGQQDQTDPIVVIILHSDWGSRQADTEKLLAVVESGIASDKY